MNRGKSICNSLKAIRQRIADANGIIYTPRPCHHEGECKGTCPACEAEVRYLEDQIAMRTQYGMAAQVVGVAMGLGMLGAPAEASAQVCKPKGYDPALSPISASPLLQKRDSIEKAGSVIVKGRVKTADSQPFVRAMVGTDDNPNLTLTNAEGEFITCIPRKANLVVRGLGMADKQVVFNNLKLDDFNTVTLYESGEVLGNIKVMAIPQGEKDGKQQLQGVYHPTTSPITESPVYLKRDSLEKAGGIVVYGRVTDGKTPLTGVCITTTTSRNRTETNTKGEFIICMAAGASLIFSYPGMERTKIPSDRLKTNEWNRITLKEDTSIMGECPVMPKAKAKKQSAK